MPNVNVPVKSATGSGVSVQPTIAIRDSSFLHLDAAIIFVCQSVEIQDNYNENTTDVAKLNQKSTYRACVLGALFTGVAFLESAINEVFLDAVESVPEDLRTRKGRRRAFTYDEMIPYATVKSLDRSVISSMARMWLQQQMIESWDNAFPCLFNFLDGEKRNHTRPNLARSWPTFDKYQLALYLNSKRRFESQPFGKAHPMKEDIFALINFRDYLIHFKPGWSVSAPKGGAIAPVGDDTAAIKSQVETLISKDKGRPPGGYSHEKDLLASGFPHDCLSAAFANAALQSILHFDDQFSKRMGIESARSRFKLEPRLSTVPPL